MFYARIGIHEAKQIISLSHLLQKELSIFLTKLLQDIEKHKSSRWPSCSTYGLRALCEIRFEIYRQVYCEVKHGGEICTAAK